MDRGAWQAAVHGVAKDKTWQRDEHFQFPWPNFLVREPVSWLSEDSGSPSPLGSLACPPALSSPGSEEPESSLVYIYVMVVLGTLVCGLTLGCLFKR